MCLVLPIFFVSPTTLTPFHNQAWQLIENKVDNKEMVQTDIFGVIKHPIQVQFENKKIENEKKKAEEERLRKEKELEEQKKNEPKLQDFVLTYYGLLSSECGNTKGITASGKKISRGMIASPPQLKFGTKIIIEGNEYVVEDRGSSKYIKVNNDGSIRLDVYLERLDGESDKEYYNRIQSKGVKRLKGYIVK
jgi:3D (Asp-Asp-Asp) domain-containing protein